MHQHIINASLQVLPVVNDQHPYRWVDEAIEVIRQTHIRHEVGPFATVVEGTYDDVLRVIHAVNEYLYSRHCNEWILNVQLQIRSHGDITAGEKTAAYK
jgi:uncharacterized protein YqgV (UPF0045/DUF77 family)